MVFGWVLLCLGFGAGREGAEPSWVWVCSAGVCESFQKRADQDVTIVLEVSISLPLALHQSGTPPPKSVAGGVPQLQRPTDLPGAPGQLHNALRRLLSWPLDIRGGTKWPLPPQPARGRQCGRGSLPSAGSSF